MSCVISAWSETSDSRRSNWACGFVVLKILATALAA
jgi:hypothetical protein